MAITSGHFHTILVDEPEAFLHPPLARKLGRHLARLTENPGVAFFASTHSPDFLMGCIQGSREVRVVRLEYRSNKSRGRLVNPEKLGEFMKKPIIRNSNVISSLFYDGVVVTESDNDRVFYSEIYHRLSETFDDYPSIQFANAQNKQTIKDIIGPLREFGVPAAAITDIDILKDGGKTWTDWLTAARLPGALHSGLGLQRSELKLRFEETGKDMKRDGGTDILNENDRLAADQFFDHLSEYGIFAVRRGELENWMPSLGVAGKKTDWAIGMLNRMGDDPLSADYVRPEDNDVWDFMRRIANWVKDTGRKGISH